MNKNTAIALSVLLILGVRAGAQQAPPDTNSQENQIVKLSPYEVDTTRDSGFLSRNTLSSYGTNASIMDVSQTLNIISPELRADFNTDFQYDTTVWGSAGVTRRSFNPGDDQFIWGFRSHTLMRDGLDINTSGINFINTDYDVDRIEVIKGPAGLLFGQDAQVGGVINVVTRQPTANPHQELNVSFGSFDYEKVDAHVSGPVVKGVEYRVDAGETNSHYGDNTPHGLYKDAFGGAAFNYHLSANTTLKVEGNVLTQDYAYPITLADPLTGHMYKGNPTLNLNEPNDHAPLRQEFFAAQLLTAIGDDIQMRTYVFYENEDSGPQWRSDWVTINPATTTLTGQVDNIYFPVHFITYGQDFSKDYAFPAINLDQKISIGFDTRADSTYHFSQSETVPSINYVNPVYSSATGGYASVPGSLVSTYQRDHLTAIYAQDVFNFFGGAVQPVLGVRYNDFENDVGTLPLPPGGATETVQHQSKIVDRVGVLIHPVHDTTLYYNHSQSFLFNTGTTPFGQPLSPSVGVSDDGGAKLELFNGALMLNATYFWTRLTNVRVAFIEPAGYPQPGLQGLSTQGFQASHGEDLSAYASKKFGSGELDFLATYFHGRLRDNNGLRVVGPADNTYSLFATFKFTQGPISGFGFGGGVRFQGQRQGYNYAASLNLPQVYWDAYTDTDVMAFYEFWRIRIQLSCDDLSGARWAEGGEGPMWIYPNTGRDLKCKLTYKF